MRNWSIKEDGAAVAFLFVLAVLYFFPVLIEGNKRVLSSIGTDTWSQFFYWRRFAYATLGHGGLPLWNPYVFSGTPYVAGIQSAIFYPLNILYLLFDTPFAINLSITIHCFLASLFTYLFARYIDIGRIGSILSAVTFTYGAPYFFHIYPGHLSIVSAVVWLPLMFLGMEALLRKKDIKYALLSGLALSMQLLAGHPQYVFYSAIAVSLYFVLHLVVRKELKGSIWFFLMGFSVFVITGISLSAVQLLPTFELTRYSVREALSYEWVSTFSLPPENLITLLLPDLFGNMLNVPYWGKNYLWEMSVYLGVIPLAMVAAGILLERSKYVFIFSLIAAISLIIALGKYTPLLMALYNYVPGFAVFRGLSKFVFIFAFASSMIAGYGLEKVISLAQEKSPKIQHVPSILVATAVVLISLGIVSHLYGYGFWKSIIGAYLTGEDRYEPLPSLTDDFVNGARGVVFMTILKTSILSILLAGLLFILPRVKKLPIQSLIISVLALAVIDLWTFGSRYVVTFDPKAAYMDQKLRAFLQGDREPFRVATPIFHLLNMGMLEGIENIGGYDVIVLKDYSEFANFAQGLPFDEPNLVIKIHGISPLLNLMNVKYYILEPAMNIGIPTFDLVFQNDRYKVYRNNEALPRSFVVHDAWVIKDRDATFRHMASPGFSPTSYAIIEEPIDTLIYNSTMRSPVPRVVEHSSNKVLVEANLRQPGLLVLGDVYYPGWKAFVDEKETKIYRANYVMRAVFLPKGRHSVEFRYQPLSFKIGAIISLVSLVLVVGYFLWVSRKSSAARVSRTR